MAEGGLWVDQGLRQRELLGSVGGGARVVLDAVDVQDLRFPGKLEPRHRDTPQHGPVVVGVCPRISEDPLR